MFPEFFIKISFEIENLNVDDDVQKKGTMKKNTPKWTVRKMNDLHNEILPQNKFISEDCILYV